MKRWIFSLLCGIVAGIIDIIPMMIQRLDRYSIISAFVHWIIVAFVINYSQVPLRGWLKGMTVAVGLAVPVIIIVMKTEFYAVVPMVVMSGILGSVIGLIEGKYAKLRS